MEKAVAAAVFSALALGAVEVERADHGPLPPAGDLRIPIPTEDGVTYEVIVTKPGLPRSVPAAP